jgi:hypothetical protein
MLPRAVTFDRRSRLAAWAAPALSDEIGGCSPASTLCARTLAAPAVAPTRRSTAAISRPWTPGSPPGQAAVHALRFHETAGQRTQA